MVLIAKSHIKRRFSAALCNYEREATAQRMINRNLLTLLQKTGKSEFDHILEIGCGTGNLTAQLARNLKVEQWTLNDLCDTASIIEKILTPQSFRFYCCDGETFPFDEYYDLIASASCVQWFYDKADFVRRCAERLMPGGLLLLSTFTPGNLCEVKQLSGRGLDYPTPEQWRSWLRQDFHLLAFEQYEIRLRFDSPAEVLRHLKHSGVTATQQEIWTKGRLADFYRQYEKYYSEPDNQVRLTYTPLLMLAQKKGL
ncbi:malonyl-CoA O-methyltransferase [Mesocricetibacter intestinalis]|uniref:Malonyl-[acyl-carrier protein] O-methyltransferase n=1 Tax=Mesocricetibacter intestinalis TaxID=1521930 RepID=A0A4R6VCS0_9PAST|nr:malonyl-ACP O-methyltransferase BioC [Mesocricetibacter intestinalis]TDQ58035.1 malonyl-CoA O-methyltransferase [Mesocricetibacter intestinalis]